MASVLRQPYGVITSTATQLLLQHLLSNLALLLRYLVMVIVLVARSMIGSVRTRRACAEIASESL